MRHFLLMTLLSGVLWGQAHPTPPTLPSSVPPSTRPTPTGSTVAVHSGDNLQTKYNAATCGQDLVLDDGSDVCPAILFLASNAAPPTGFW